MKRILVLALASCLAVNSFAAEGKLKSKKGKKAAKTEKVCPASCKQTGCNM